FRFFWLILFMSIIAVVTTLSFSLSFNPISILLSLPLLSKIFGGIAVALVIALIAFWCYFYSTYNFCWGHQKIYFDRKRGRGEKVIWGLSVPLGVAIIGAVIGGFVFVH